MTRRHWLQRGAGAFAALALPGWGGCAAIGSGSAGSVPGIPGAPGPAGDLPPPAPREFRGAWVASVANID